MQIGESVCYTDDMELAAALTALDIQPLPDAPYFYSLRNGVERTIWNFPERNSTGEFLTVDLIKAFYDEEWFKQNPWHPFTMAVHAVKNFRTYESWIEEDIPYASFDVGGGKLLHTKLGSPDYVKAIESGLRPL